MIVYHGTSEANIESILRVGFRNGPSEYWIGVWLADLILTANDGIMGAIYAVWLDVPEDVLKRFEVTEEKGTPYRVFVIPADILNGYQANRTLECPTCFADYGGEHCPECARDAAGHGT